MHIWIILVALLNTPAPGYDAGMSPQDTAPIVRYRGIDSLLAKFEAESE